MGDRGAVGGAGPWQGLQLGAVTAQAAPGEFGAGAGRARGAVAQHALALDGGRWGQGQNSLGCRLSWRGDLDSCKGSNRVRSGDAAALKTFVLWRAVLGDH